MYFLVSQSGLACLVQEKISPFIAEAPAGGESSIVQMVTLSKPNDLTGELTVPSALTGYGAWGARATSASTANSSFTRSVTNLSILNVADMHYSQNQ